MQYLVSSTLQNLILQGLVNSSPTSQRILLIETPATPIPEEDAELVTSSDQPQVSPNPSKSKGTATETSTSSRMEPTPGKPATIPKEETEFVTSANQLSASSSPSEPKETVNNTSTDSRTDPTSGEHSTGTKTNERSKKKNSVGPGGFWLFEDQSESTKEDGKAEKPGKRGSIGSGGADDKNDTFGDDKTTPRTRSSPEDSHVKASLADVSVAVDQENKPSLKNNGQDKTSEDSEEKKKDADEKASSLLFGNGKNSYKSESSTGESKNEKKMDDKENRDNQSGKDSSIDERIGPDNRNVKHDLMKGDDAAKEVKHEENDGIKRESGKEAGKGDDRRNIEMIDEEDGEMGDDDDDVDDGEEDDGDGDGDEGKEGGAIDAAGGSQGARRARGRKRRKKIGYGKLKWNAASKVDTGSGTYERRKSVKKIPNFKNDYSHVRSRLSTLSEANNGSEKATANASPPRQRSVSISKNPLPDYSNVRPRLYNGARGYNSEMSSTVPKTQQTS